VDVGRSQQGFIEPMAGVGPDRIHDAEPRFGCHFFEAEKCRYLPRFRWILHKCFSCHMARMLASECTVETKSLPMFPQELVDMVTDIQCEVLRCASDARDGRGEVRESRQRGVKDGRSAGKQR